MGNSIETGKAPRVSRADKVVKHVISVAEQRADEKGKLRYVDFQLKEVAGAVGVSASYVRTVFDIQLSHVLANENDGHGWGIITGTLPEFLREVAKPPLSADAAQGPSIPVSHHGFGRNTVHARGHGPYRTE
jgi:hypothetical protein